MFVAIGLMILCSLFISLNSFYKIILAFNLKKLKVSKINQIINLPSKELVIEGKVKTNQSKFKNIAGKDCVFNHLCVEKKISSGFLTFWEEMWVGSKSEPFYIEDDSSKLLFHLKSNSKLNDSTILDTKIYNPKKMSQDEIGNFSALYDGCVEDFRFHDQNDTYRILFTPFFRIVEISIVCDQHLLIYGELKKISELENKYTFEEFTEENTDNGSSSLDNKKNPPIFIKYKHSEFFKSPVFIVSAFFFLLNLIIIFVFAYFFFKSKTR
jgi:hypothetical protein